MPRPRRRRLTDHDFARALQDLRLGWLERGSCEPLSIREALYVRLLRAGERPDREDFILSPVLLRLEAAQMRAEADALTDDAPFTPSPEPAISRP